MTMGLVERDEDLSLEAYDYDLPRESIALFPPAVRPMARLMKISRQDGSRSHHQFSAIAEFLNSGDVLVLNDTRVIPARLLGVKQETGGRVEAFLLKQIAPHRWEALMKPSGRIAAGQTLIFEGRGARLEGVVLDAPRENSGLRSLEFRDEKALEKIRELGHMPLPPYLGREDAESDRQDYQTVFARREGAVAAPTAGLHFDDALLAQLRQRGVEILFITLHTGYGTFQPVEVKDIRGHRMFEEEFEVSEETAAALNRARAEGRRVIACGTTVVRALEAAAVAPGKIQPLRSATNLFIYPSYEFRIADAIITNFHLPQSTLLMLVSAFLGRRRLLDAYEEAVKTGYRFYSYGDAMLVL